MSFDLIRPLIEETVNKLKVSYPRESQTGPASRNDINTMENHLEILPNESLKSIYRALSEAIFDVFAHR